MMRVRASLRRGRGPGGLPGVVRLRARQLDVPPTQRVLVVSVAEQRLAWWETTGPGWSHRCRGLYRISTSRFGVGTRENSRRTPTGLHRIARKIGGGWPPGTVFRGRRPVGYTWRGRPEAAIAHRVLWLEGLEPGHNRGGGCDSFARSIYLHGLGAERSLGRPTSQGCIHLAGSDLCAMFDRLAEGDLVWIGIGPLRFPTVSGPAGPSGGPRFFGSGLL